MNHVSVVCKRKECKRADQSVESIKAMPAPTVARDTPSHPAFVIVAALDPFGDVSTPFGIPLNVAVAVGIDVNVAMVLLPTTIPPLAGVGAGDPVVYARR
jgi:hypothetical protein